MIDNQGVYMLLMIIPVLLCIKYRDAKNFINRIKNKKKLNIVNKNVNRK